MCGIAGILRHGRFDHDLRSVAQRMEAALVHRGPDAAGVWVDDGAGIALSHCRLSIIDLSQAGAQPMRSVSGRFQLAYNGEIYNHLELREALGGDGPAEWRGHSDTETLLACIELWGLEETLRRAKGMFALALWDRKTGALSLARDRLGEKPLFYGWSNGTFLFGSELKALRAFPGFNNAISREALTHYLRLSYVPAPLSIYENVFKLEPGCILTAEGLAGANAPVSALRPGERHGNVAISRWYDFAAVAQAGMTSPIDDPAVARKELERALRQSVARQSIADVPLGAFLSGGVDSSLIVALMQDQSAIPVNSFTIAFEDPAYDEAPFAKAVADHIGTSHSEMLVTAADAQDVIADLPSIYDEPFADSSQIPTLMVCRAARRDVTVALSGDAGDELFGGYNRYFWAPRVWQTAGAIPLPLRKLMASAALAMPSPVWNSFGNLANRLRGKSAGVARWDEKVAKLATTAGNAGSLEEFYVRLVSQWQNPEAIALGGGSGLLPPLMTDPLPQTLANDPVTRMMARDSLTYLPDDILCKVDRAAMAVSLETRVPFLDPDVVELAWRIPTAMKIDGQVGKSILRDVLYDHVPKQLIERPKTGFGIPIGQWLRGPLREWAEGLLEENRLRKEGYFSAPAIRAVWDSHLSGKSDNTAQLWSVLMFQAWHEQTLT